MLDVVAIVDVFVVFCLFAAFHHIAAKHFNFTGVQPPCAPAYGMKCCVRAYSKKVRNINKHINKDEIVTYI